MTDIVDRLRELTKQGEDYIWRPAADAVSEIKRLRAALKHIGDRVVGPNADLKGDIADIVRRALANCPAPVSPSPPANEVSHPSLASAASGMLAALEPVYAACLSGDFYADHDEACRLLGLMRTSIESARAALSKES